MFRTDRDVVVALVHGRMVGYAMGVLIEREGMLVGEMWGAVRPEDRRQGIGTALWRANRDAPGRGGSRGSRGPDPASCARTRSTMRPPTAP